jgi:hypothetical protein
VGAPIDRHGAHQLDALDRLHRHSSSKCAPGTASLSAANAARSSASRGRSACVPPSGTRRRGRSRTTLSVSTVGKRRSTATFSRIAALLAQPVPPQHEFPDGCHRRSSSNRAPGNTARNAGIAACSGASSGRSASQHPRQTPHTLGETASGARHE